MRTWQRVFLTPAASLTENHFLGPSTTPPLALAPPVESGSGRICFGEYVERSDETKRPICCEIKEDKSIIKHQKAKQTQRPYLPAVNASSSVLRVVQNVPTA